MKTTDELVRELADREALRDLAIRYIDLLWRNDLDGLVSLFIEDGSFLAENPENEVVARGHAELKKMFQKAVNTVQPRHYIHTHIVELRGGDRATGRCHVELRSAKVGLQWIGSGCYEDEYTRVGEQWKLASRRFIENDMAIALRSFIAS